MEYADSDLKEICFFANSKNSLKNIYKNLAKSQIVSEMKFDSASKTSQFTTKDPDKNKIRISYNPSIEKRKERTGWGYIGLKYLRFLGKLA